MENFEILKRKLEAFLKRYYLNELLKGAILFTGIGLLYLLIILIIEYFFWLSPLWRSVLFWGVVVVESLLFLKFIVYPVLRLLKLSRGLDYAGASRIIGNHFPEVNDKLLNLLQLKRDDRQSDLLLASIDQKAGELRPVPFSLAVNFKQNVHFLKYAVVPVLILLLVYFSGNFHVFSDSYERVVHYKVAYEPPAPFVFSVLNADLRVQENEDLRLQVSTDGKVIPENVSINFGNESFYLNQMGPGIFEFTFESLKEGVSFYLTANGVRSREYAIEVVEVPRLTDFRMHLDFPGHTGLKSEMVDGTGNATVPEGTRIRWELKTRATEEVTIQFKDTTEFFVKNDQDFSFEKPLYQNSSYQISTSNGRVKDFEKVDYSIEVVRDSYPELKLEDDVDSLDLRTRYFFGKASDDYGVSRVQLVVVPADDPEGAVVRKLPISQGTYAEFLYAFPDTLDLEEGRDYDYYFEVYDNDALHNFKKIRSKTFSYREKTVAEEKEERLKQQNDVIEKLNTSLEDIKLSEKDFKELERMRKEKQELSYSDRKRLEHLLQRQKEQNKLMKSYSEKLKESLENDVDSRSSDMREKLKERLEDKEEKLRENEKLLEELQRYADKMNDEGLRERLEKLSRNNQNQEKSLEQLLELTKRYYIEEKAAKIARDLEELAGRQEELSEKGEENTDEAQDALDEEFDNIRKNIRQLDEENGNLEKPMETGSDPTTEEEIDREQQEAGENLRKQDQEGAKKNQKKAAEKMKELSKKMDQQMRQGGQEQMQEDAEMLRKILDNLITFSFGQEELLERFRAGGRGNPGFAGNLRKQNVLKENFQHIDDSLYALALRNPMITEKITEKITDIEYDLEKSLERLAESELDQGLASQQYVVMGSNDLAYFLSQALDNMQDMMDQSGKGQGTGRSGPGEGGGSGKQLPDIIKEQGELKQEMQEGLMKRGGSKEDGEGEGQGRGEEESGQLFEIFQRQQLLRKALEDQLREKGMEGHGEGLRQEMEQLEEEILLKGFNESSIRNMMNLEHKLLELEEAMMEQGEKSEREARTNQKEFENRTNNQIIKAKEYFNTTEILNRQTLPLRRIYKQKVREYFERGND